MKTGMGLIGFIKAECANWVESRGQKGRCIGVDISGETKFNDSSRCWVIEGKPCKHFEECVLGPSDYQYRLPNYDYEKLFDQYAKVNPRYLVKTVTVRRCGCGTPLLPRHRYCEKCAHNRVREASRERQRKFRNHVLSA